MKGVSNSPLAAASRIIVVILAVALGGCATSEEVRLQQRVKELEQERSALITHAFKQDQYIRDLHRGMEIQARMAAQLRDTCEL